MNTWDENIFDTKINSLNQALTKKEFSPLEFDGLLLRVARVFDYMLFCLEEFDRSDDIEDLIEKVYRIYEDYQRYINHPELIDEAATLYELKESVVPLFNLIASIIEENMTAYKMPNREFIDSLTDKQKRRYTDIINMISKFSMARLDKSYFVLGCEATERLFMKEESAIERGQTRTWAAGIIYALCKANGILGNNFGHIVSPGEIYDYFGVSSSTALLKSKIVIKLLNVVEGAKEWIGEDLSEWEEEDYDLDDIDFDSPNWMLGKLSVKEHQIYDKARNVLQDALEDDNVSEIISASKKCLDMSPYVAEAYYYLASYGANTVEEAYNYVNDGINMIESVWDERVMKETIGHFWFDINTRPYMRLLNVKLEILEEENNLEEALELARYMILLCPNDNIGVRYRFINLLLKVNDFEGIDQLSAAYENEMSLGWNYSMALRYFKDNQLEKAKDSYEKAFEINKYIVQYLLGSKAIKYPLPDVYSIGSEEEAMLYVERAKIIWDDTRDAIKWLKAVKLGKAFIHVLH